MEKVEKSSNEKRGRNSEKRKEKSRDAARCRRSKESEIFSDLAQVLPLPATTIAHLDKASIMRLVITHLRMRAICSKFKMEDLKADEDGLLLKALGGVVLIISLDGDIVYVSNNVSFCLGVSQVDLLGQSIYEVSHPCDHNEIRALLSGKSSNVGKISIFLRLKSTITSKGRSVNLKSANFKVMNVNGYLMKMDDTEKESTHFVALASPIPHPADIQVPLGTYTFLSKHSLDMKYTYADERMTNFLGYNPESLIGKSLYEFHHVQDNKDIEKAFKSLFAKGQSETGHYRFLAQGGGYVWVSTQATLIYGDKGHKPNSVVCVNYVISERFNEVEIYSSNQLEGIEVKKEAEIEESRPVLSTSRVFVSFKSETKEETSREALPRPQPATSKIFAPKTEDMNKGFLMFSDDESGFTMLKDEPEDLTHLAPTAGDVCVPLANPMIDQMFESLMPDNYSPLINEEKDAPFFASYRDDISNGSLSPTLSQSPGGCSLPSLCSLGDESNRFEDTTVKTLLGLDQTLDLVDPDSDDLTVKAPYIPMTEGDDLPLLMNADLMWGVNFTPTCNSSPSESSSPTVLASDNLKTSSSLATLLKSDSKQSCSKYQDQGGGNKNWALVIDSSFLSQYSTESGDPERRKRGSSLEQFSAKKRKQQPSTTADGESNSSVLMNLLVAGCDASAGYKCVNPRKANKPPSQQTRRNS